MGKRKLGIYRDGGNSWLKVKNRTYSQAEGTAGTADTRQISSKQFCMVPEEAFSQQPLSGKFVEKSERQVRIQFPAHCLDRYSELPYRFPDLLGPTCRPVRRMGMTPSLWIRESTKDLMSLAVG